MYVSIHQWRRSAEVLFLSRTEDQEKIPAGSDRRTEAQGRRIIRRCYRNACEESCRDPDHSPELAKLTALSPEEVEQDVKELEGQGKSMHFQCGKIRMYGTAIRQERQNIFC